MEYVYDKYADFLFRLALANVLNRDDAEDIVHDVFIRYYEKNPHFSNEAHEKAWFIRVTSNMCHDFHRKKSHRSYTPLDEVEDLTGEDGENIKILQYLSEIPQNYRSVIELHYIEGYSVKEVSQMLFLTDSAVKMRLKRGRQLLREIIEKEERYV